MRNLVRNWIAASGTALLAVALAGAIPAFADDSDTAANQQVQQQQFEQMQGRMQVMHALMAEINQTKDPAVRQQLMDQEYRLMREQMSAMGMMNGQMMGHGIMGNGTMSHGTMGGGMMGGGMMGGGMYGGSMMQPESRNPTN